MIKLQIMVILVLITLLALPAWAVDDSVIDSLQMDVSNTTTKADLNENKIKNLEQSMGGGLPVLQAQVNDIQTQINNIELTPGPQGEQGPRGSDGLSCWDTNGDGFADDAEDVNGDSSWDSLDCQGSMALGPPSSAPANPVLGDMYYSDSEAICVFMESGWVKIVGDGFCVLDCSPDGRFCNNGDGTISDTFTGLMWAASTNIVDINWAAADAYCTAYTGGNYTDWRMPTTEELQEIYNAGVRDHNQHDYIKVGNVYAYVWSSETSIGGSSETGWYDSAISVSFYDGDAYWHPQTASEPQRALPVRVGN